MNPTRGCGTLVGSRLLLLRRHIAELLSPGDLIRVAGYLGLPRISANPMWLDVLTPNCSTLWPWTSHDDATDQADATIAMASS